MRLNVLSVAAELPLELHSHRTHLCSDVGVSYSSSGSRWLLLLNSVYSKYMDWIEVFSLDASERCNYAQLHPAKASNLYQSGLIGSLFWFQIPLLEYRRVLNTIAIAAMHSLSHRLACTAQADNSIPDTAIPEPSARPYAKSLEISNYFPNKTTTSLGSSDELR